MAKKVHLGFSITFYGKKSKLFGQPNNRDLNWIIRVLEWNTPRMIFPCCLALVIFMWYLPFDAHILREIWKIWAKYHRWATKVIQDWNLARWRGGAQGCKFKKEGVVLTGEEVENWLKQLKIDLTAFNRLDFSVRRMFTHISSSKGK